MHFNVAWTNRHGELKVFENHHHLADEERVAEMAAHYPDEIWFFSETPEFRPAGAWAIYSYNYYPYVASIHASEEETQAFLNVSPSGKYFYIFWPFGSDFEETLEESGRPILEKDL